MALAPARNYPSKLSQNRPNSAMERRAARERRRSVAYNVGMNLDTALTLLAEEPAAPLDVAELALRVAQDEYPDLDVEAYLSELDGMAREAQNYLGGNLETQ